MDALKIISEGSIKAEKPQFNVGDTVRVDVRIKEGERERIQAFEGTVIAKKHGGVAETFTVRRVSYGPSCSICVVVPARLLRSRAIFDDPRVKPGEKGQLVVPFFFIPGQTRL